MRATFRPIETLSGQTVSARFDCLEIDSLAGKPLSPVLFFKLVTFALSAYKPAPTFQSGGDGDREFSGQMIITTASVTQRSCSTWKRRRAKDRRFFSKQSQLLDHLCNAGVRQSVVAMPSLYFHCQESAIDKFC
jgi:hypothetical protein